MKFYDKSTGFFIADPTVDPLKGAYPTVKEIEKSLEGYILSASGWRAVFAESKKDEDNTTRITAADKVITATVVRAFVQWLNLPRPRVLIGCDARPTGEVLCDIVARTFIALGCDVSNLYIASAPEIMAYSNTGYDAFFYISASHNPIGHNGFKFGYNGGVCNKDEIDEILPIFRELIDNENVAAVARDLSANMDQDSYLEVLMQHDETKQSAFEYYKGFVKRIATAHKLFNIPFGIVAEMNGSARSAFVDIPYLNQMGAKVWAVNAYPRQIAHAIVPEGENLELCRKTLEEMHAKDPDYIIGYVPDNDGDRGNFCYTRSDGKAYILNAQEVFALVATIDLAHQTMTGDKNPAIVVNGPTSSLIDDVAKRLGGVTVFRSDVGEANVVMLSEIKRKEGYQVHVCGEGSNGGIITHPARVRDPMNSIMSIAKLYSVPGLYEYLLEKLGVENPGKISLEAIIDALPKYTVTPAFSKDAVLRIKCPDFDAFKLAYEELLQKEIGNFIGKDGFASWEARQIEGLVEQVGVGPEFRNHPSTGGYKVVFYDENGEYLAYIWLSKSKTEPVMRVMADVKGDNQKLHDKLLKFQRSLVLRACEIFK